MSAIGGPVHLFQQSVTVQRRTDSVTKGSPAFTWASHLTNVTCHIQQSGGSEGDLYNGERNRRQYTVFTGTGQDITAKDRIQYTDATTGSNITRTLKIDSVNVVNYMRPLVLELICEEID